MTVTTNLYGQSNHVRKSTLPQKTSYGKQSYTDSISIELNRYICKGLDVVLHKKEAVQQDTPKPQFNHIVTQPKPLLQIHGNVLYDMNYRSNVDTPYAEKDIYQHTVQTYLDVTYKDNYPVRVYFTTRFSNSNLFKNFSDLNLQFNPADFSNRIKDRLKARVGKFISMDSLNALRDSLEKKFKKYLSLKNELDNPNNQQRMVEKKERELYGHRQGLVPDAANLLANSKANAMTAFKTRNYKFAEKSDEGTEGRLDSTTAKIDRIQEEYKEKKQQLDSLMAQLAEAQKKYETGKKWVNSNSTDLINAIDGIKNYDQLKSMMGKLNMPDTAMPKGYKTLVSIRSLSVGRSLVDYSELSAKNISISGLQAEYNPRWYYAVAAGTINYRFRDFVVQNPNQVQQYMALVRVGKGMKDGNNIIATYYTGKRQLYNYSTNGGVQQPGNNAPDYRLMGFTVEANYKLGTHSTVTAEVAKSSLPFYSIDRTSNEKTFNTTFKFNDRSNEAYSIKLVSFLPHTQTSINGFYKHIGENFQSFSVFTSGSSQGSWSLRVNQPFFKRKLTIAASVRANDFSNPFITTGYSSTTVFKSIQATLRIKRYPVVSIGYFPSSQLTKLGDNSFIENLFYTFTSTVNHFYKAGHNTMNTSLVYTRFYNKGSDSGFVYFNTNNLMLSHSIFLNKLTLQANVSIASNTEYNLYVLENTFQYKLNGFLSIGAGYKYNKQTFFNKELWGYSGTAIIRLPKMGEFQLMADEGFIPGGNKQLVRNATGRITYFKTF